MLGSGRFGFCFAMMTVSTGMLGCEPVDPDRVARAEWIRAVGDDAGVGLRAVLNGTGAVQYHSGFYPLEYDPESHGAWRWMSRRGIIRLKTHKSRRQPHATDMDLEVFGWVPMEPKELRTFHLEFSLNGHVLGRYEPESSKLFSQKFSIPKDLIDNAEWVDLVITVANTVRPANDWRDLGFATTGVIWQPVGQR
jgi:hypothetical protein